MGSTSRFGLTAPPSDQVEELRRWLRVKASGGTLLQQPIERRCLWVGVVAAHIYSLITCADPLRVYLHAEGFALFASHAYNSTDPAADPYGFLTNAAVNRGEPAAIFNAGVSASSASAAKEGRGRVRQVASGGYGTTTASQARSGSVSPTSVGASTAS